MKTKCSESEVCEKVYANKFTDYAWTPIKCYFYNRLKNPFNHYTYHGVLGLKGYWY